MIYANDAVLLQRGEMLSPEAAFQRMLCCMNSRTCQFFVIPNDFTGKAAELDLNTLLRYAIELDGTTKGNALSRTYAVGRFYWLTNKESEDFPQLNGLYSRLVKYVKKEYHYHRESKVYFSHAFEDNMEAKHLSAVYENGRRII